MGPQASVNSLLSVTHLAVLDTNAVLAWLWFDDPGLTALGSALQSGQIAWIASLAMRQELDRVLQRLPPRAGRDSSRSAVLTTFDRLATVKRAAAPDRSLTCTDSSDQMFIDLALGEGARWLFSRDRAVMKLRRRAAARGLHICPPEHWPPDDLNA